MPWQASIRRFVRGSVAFAVVAYVAALVAVTVSLRLFGERTWWLLVLLYSPRLLLLAPLLVLLPPTALMRSRWLWGLLGVALLVGLFPLAGLTLAGWRSPSVHQLDDPADRARTHTLRIFSHNVWFGRGGIPALIEAINRAQPDIVSLQAMNGRTAHALRASLPGWNFYVGPDLLVATKLPIADVYEPPPFSLNASNLALANDPDPALPLPPELEGGDDEDSLADDAKPTQPAMFVRLTLTTPYGPVDFYDLHPYSPRHAIEDLRGDGWRSVLAHGLPTGAARVWARNSAIRAEQVRRLTADVEQRVHPVILAGDSNLPSDSALFRHFLARYQDGFASHGVGLGYTFPAHRRVRWLRIDRVLAGPGAHIVDFAVGDHTGSDHRPVLADVEIIGR